MKFKDVGVGHLFVNRNGYLSVRVHSQDTAGCIFEWNKTWDGGHLVWSDPNEQVSEIGVPKVTSCTTHAVEIKR